MKRKLSVILAICIMIFVLTGCKDVGDKTNDNYFTIVEVVDDIGTYVVYANDTKVMYMLYASKYGGGITPLYNADGTLQIYNGN